MADLLDIVKDFKVLAIEKIDKELKEFKGDKYGQAVHTYVANALREFCAKSDRFAEVLYKTKRSMSDCVKEIMKGCGQHISDIEVYRRAARFYFPNSEVDFVMTITTSGDAPDETYIRKEPLKEEPPKPKKESKPKELPKKPEKPNPAQKKKKEAEVIQLSLF